MLTRQPFDGGDVRIENHGSLVMFRPLTDESREWLVKNTDARTWMWQDDMNGLMIDPRMAMHIIGGLHAAGFELGGAL